MAQASLLRANNKTLEEKASAAEKLKAALDELRGGLEAQNRAGREAIAKRDEEGRHLQQYAAAQTAGGGCGRGKAH